MSIKKIQSLISIGLITQLLMPIHLILAQESANIDSDSPSSLEVAEEKVTVESESHVPVSETSKMEDSQENTETPLALANEDKGVNDSSSEAVEASNPDHLPVPDQESEEDSKLLDPKLRDQLADIHRQIVDSQSSPADKWRLTRESLAAIKRAQADPVLTGQYLNRVYPDWYKSADLRQSSHYLMLNWMNQAVAPYRYQEDHNLNDKFHQTQLASDQLLAFFESVEQRRKSYRFELASQLLSRASQGTSSPFIRQELASQLIDEIIKSPVDLSIKNDYLRQANLYGWLADKDLSQQLRFAAFESFRQNQAESKEYPASLWLAGLDQLINRRDLPQGWVSDLPKFLSIYHPEDLEALEDYYKDREAIDGDSIRSQPNLAQDPWGDLRRKLRADLSLDRLNRQLEEVGYRQQVSQFSFKERWDYLSQLPIWKLEGVYDVREGNYPQFILAHLQNIDSNLIPSNLEEFRYLIDVINQIATEEVKYLQAAMSDRDYASQVALNRLLADVESDWNRFGEGDTKDRLQFLLGLFRLKDAPGMSQNGSFYSLAQLLARIQEKFPHFLPSIDREHVSPELILEFANKQATSDQFKVRGLLEALDLQVIKRPHPKFLFDFLKDQSHAQLEQPEDDWQRLIEIGQVAQANQLNMSNLGQLISRHFPELLPNDRSRQILYDRLQANRNLIGLLYNANFLTTEDLAYYSSLPVLKMRWLKDQENFPLTTQNGEEQLAYFYQLISQGRFNMQAALMNYLRFIEDANPQIFVKGHKLEPNQVQAYWDQLGQVKFRQLFLTYLQTVGAIDEDQYWTYYDDLERQQLEPLRQEYLALKAEAAEEDQVFQWWSGIANPKTQNRLVTSGLLDDELSWLLPHALKARIRSSFPLGNISSGGGIAGRENLRGERRLFNQEVQIPAKPDHQDRPELLPEPPSTEIEAKKPQGDEAKPNPPEVQPETNQPTPDPEPYPPSLTLKDTEETIISSTNRDLGNKEGQLPSDGLLSNRGGSEVMNRNIDSLEPSSATDQLSSDRVDPNLSLRAVTGERSNRVEARETDRQEASKDNGESASDATHSQKSKLQSSQKKDKGRSSVESPYSPSGLLLVVSLILLCLGIYSYTKRHH
ncbi:hypothetical protein [Hutsoniella sourekii]|uniref:hypothetical protein n=1 Tax=Hutsoniella sourekii TaxID=87650 RepID=UPI00048512F4|nr:hypothetical protein [Hutsoniella sourekii]